MTWDQSPQQRLIQSSGQPANCDHVCLFPFLFTSGYRRKMQQPGKYSVCAHVCVYVSVWQFNQKRPTIKSRLITQSKVCFWNKPAQTPLISNWRCRWDESVTVPHYGMKNQAPGWTFTVNPSVCLKCVLEWKWLDWRFSASSDVWTTASLKMSE